MLQFLKKKTKATGRVGLMVQSDQLVLAHVDQRGGSPFMLNCKRVPLASPTEAAAILEDLVKEYEMGELSAALSSTQKITICIWSRRLTLSLTN